MNDPKLDDHILNCSMVQFGGKASKWAFSKKGTVYELEIGIEGKKKVLKMHKVLELNYPLADITCLS